MKSLLPLSAAVVSAAVSAFSDVAALALSVVELPASLLVLDESPHPATIDAAIAMHNIVAKTFFFIAIPP